MRLTSKTDRLVHSSTLPVAIAPRSYRTTSGVERVTVGFRDDDAGWSLLDRVAELSRTEGARLRVVTFLVTPARRPVTNSVSHSETQVIDLWSVQAAAAQTEAREHLAALGLDDVEFALATGPDWPTAVSSVAWEDRRHHGRRVVVDAPLAQVFLGSSASKIVRNSPVPVVVVPGAGG